MGNIYRLRYEEELEAAIDSEVICSEDYCPFHARHMSSPARPCCEGEYCEEAFDKYCESHPKERGY